MWMCGGRRRRGRRGRNKVGPEPRGEAAPTPGGTEAGVVGGGYVQVNTKTVLIDDGFLAMSKSSLQALRGILASHTSALEASHAELNEASRERDAAEQSRREAASAASTISDEIDAACRRIRALDANIKGVHGELRTEQERHRELEAEWARLEVKRGEVERLEQRNCDFDREILRAQTLLKQERDTRVRLQARLHAETLEATLGERQRREALAEALELSTRQIAEERGTVRHLQDRCHHLAGVLARAEAEVTALREGREAKHKAMEERMKSIGDSPLKAEYRRAHLRLQVGWI